jgi:hypothetical protein
MVLDNLLIGIIKEELDDGRDVTFSVEKTEIDKIRMKYFPRKVDATAKIDLVDSQPPTYEKTYSVKIYATARAPEGGHKC